MRNFRHFVWDFDGTLFDTYPFITACFIRALNDCGVRENEAEVRAGLMRSLAESIAFYEEKHELGEAFSQRFSEYMGAESIRTSPPYPHVVELCRLIAGSGRRNYLYTHRGISARAFLADAGIEACFANVITSADGFKRKPDPEAILFLIQKHGMNKEEVLMIGDRAIDIQCGANAGAAACLIANGAADGSIPADFTFENIGDLYREMLGAV